MTPSEQFGSKLGSQSLGALFYPPGCHACLIRGNELSKWAAGIGRSLSRTSVAVVGIVHAVPGTEFIYITWYHLIPWPAWVVVGIPLSLRGNWGWERLRNMSQMESLQMVEWGPTLEMFSCGVENSEQGASSLDLSCYDYSGWKMSLRKSFSLESRKALACRGPHMSLWLWVKKGVANSEAHTNVISCPKAPKKVLEANVAWHRQLDLCSCMSRIAWEAAYLIKKSERVTEGIFFTLKTTRIP